MILTTPDPALDDGFARVLAALHVETPDVDDEDEISLPAFRTHWIVAWERTELVGALAWRRTETVVVERLMVRRPEAWGALLAALEQM